MRQTYQTRPHRRAAADLTTATAGIGRSNRSPLEKGYGSDRLHSNGAPTCRTAQAPPEISHVRTVIGKRQPMGNTIRFTNPQPPKDSAPTGQRRSGKAILIALGA